MNVITITKKIETEDVLIQLRSDGIVHVMFKENITLDVELQMKNLKLYNEICESKKHPFLFTAFPGVTITKEARENSQNIEHLSPIGRSAVVADSLPYRIIANFYLKVNRPKNPYRVFNNENDAINWLYSGK